MKGLVKEVVDQQSGRYSAFITNFSGGFQETRLEMYKWLLYPILTSNPEKLEEGFRWNELPKILQENHPAGENFNPGNLSQALVSTHLSKSKPRYLTSSSQAARAELPVPIGAYR